MHLSKTDVDLIVERSANLAERLRGDFIPGGDGAAAAVRRLGRWQQLIANNPRCLFTDGESLTVRDPHTEVDALPLLGSVKRAPNVPAPFWAVLLADITNRVQTDFAGAADGRIAIGADRYTARSIPFDHLFRPISDIAWERVLTAEPEAVSMLSQTARNGLKISLRRRIATILAGSLYPLFLARRSMSESGMMQHFFRSPRTATTATGEQRHYREFINTEGADGLRSIFLRYPVAARLTAEITMNWIDFVREFVHRLRRDDDRLSGMFSPGQSLGVVVSIDASVSDPHRGGRSVLVLTFRNGKRLVYKPRSMQVDQIFFALIHALNATGRAARLHVLKVLDRRGYGWMEYAPHRPCSSRAQVRRFYARCGAFVSVIHRLHGIDCHRENLITAGEHPVLIDLEALGHPFRAEEIGDLASASGWSMANSVMRSGLLPLRQQNFDGRGTYDNSAYGAPEAQRSPFTSEYWSNVNSDRMAMGFKRLVDVHSEHRAHLHGRAMNIKDFVGDVLIGYRSMEKLLSGPAAESFSRYKKTINCTRRRHIKRPTLLYAMLLRRSLRPEYLSDGIDRSLELLALPADQQTEDTVIAEISALEQMDVPYFQTTKRPFSERISPMASPTPLVFADQSKLVRLAAMKKVHLQEGKLHFRPMRDAEGSRPSTKAIS